MADNLVKRLRDRRVCSLAQNSCRNDLVCEQAADRIEHLQAQRNFAQKQVVMAEAKLAKAVGQMQRVKDYRYDPNIGIELNRLEEALAELKGEK